MARKVQRRKRRKGNAMPRKQPAIGKLPPGLKRVASPHFTRFSGLADGCTTPHQIAKRLLQAAKRWRRLGERGAIIMQISGDLATFEIPGHFCSYNTATGDYGPCNRC